MLKCPSKQIDTELHKCDWGRESCENDDQRGLLIIHLVTLEYECSKGLIEIIYKILNRNYKRIFIIYKAAYKVLQINCKK